MVCLERSLPDLPAATLGLVASMAAEAGVPAAWLFAYSALTKETSVLSLGALACRAERPAPYVLWALCGNAGLA